MTTIVKAEDILSYSFNHAHPVQVRYNDIDVVGHVNNAVYHEYFNLGRMHYFYTVFGYNAIAEQKVVVAQANTSYVREVLIDDDLQVLTKIIRLGNKSFDVLQALISPDEEGFILHTFIVTTFVCVNAETHRSEVMPEEWKEAVAKFEDDITK